MDRNQKEALVSTLQNQLASAESIVVVRQSGLTVAATQTLRGLMREKDCQFRIVKNRLMKIAIKGTALEPISDMLTGPCAYAWGSDAASPAKILVDFAKKNEAIEIVGAAMDGERFDSAGVEVLSKLPSLTDLRAQLAGLMQAPAAKMAGVLEAPAVKLVGVLKAYEQKQNEDASA